jgi:hypothetical protein
MVVIDQGAGGLLDGDLLSSGCSFASGLQE